MRGDDKFRGNSSMENWLFGVSKDPWNGVCKVKNGTEAGKTAAQGGSIGSTWSVHADLGSSPSS